MMSDRAFELNVSLPYEERFAPAGGELAVHAAERAGCRQSEALSFGRAVEQVLAECLDERNPLNHVELVFRSEAGTVEVLLSCDRVFQAAAPSDRDISIQWAHNGARPICRIARPAPFP
jgi:hypothetical protein